MAEPKKNPSNKLLLVYSPRFDIGMRDDSWNFLPRFTLVRRRLLFQSDKNEPLVFPESSFIAEGQTSPGFLFSSREATKRRVPPLRLQLRQRLTNFFWACGNPINLAPLFSLGASPSPRQSPKDIGPLPLWTNDRASDPLLSRLHLFPFFFQQIYNVLVGVGRRGPLINLHGAPSIITSCPVRRRLYVSARTPSSEQAAFPFRYGPISSPSGFFSSFLVYLVVCNLFLE